MAKLYKDAAEVPAKVCETLHEGLKRCAKLSTDCGKSIASDLAEAAILMEAGFLSAKATVEINLRYTKDVAYAKKRRKTLLKLQRSASRLKKKVLHRIGR